MKNMRGAGTHLNEVAEILRVDLEAPSGAVEVFADERLGFVVGIMLTWRLEDVGGPESGPRLSVDPVKYAYLVRLPESDLAMPGGWVLHLFNNDEISNHDYRGFDGHPLATVPLIDLEHESSAAQVAASVVTLFDALNIKQEVI